MAAPPRLRPRTVGEILDASFTLYRGRFGSMLLAVTVVSIPALAAGILLAAPAGSAVAAAVAAYGDYFREAQNAHGQWTDAVKDSYLRAIDSAMSVNVFMYATTVVQSISRAGACLIGAHAVRAALRGEAAPGGWRLLGLALPRLAAGSIVQLFVSIVAMLCSICLPVPVIATALAAPACAALAFETGEIERSARRAPRLVSWAVVPFAAALDVTLRSLRLSWTGRTVARGSFLVGVLLTFVSGIVMIVSAVTGFAAHSLAAWFAANHWAEVLFLPVVGAACALWYEDLRVRREAADFDEPEKDVGAVPAGGVAR